MSAHRVSCYVLLSRSREGGGVDVRGAPVQEVLKIEDRHVAFVYSSF